MIDLLVNLVKRINNSFNKGENTMTKKELLKMIRSDLKKWSKTKDGKSYKRFYKKYKETK